MRSGRGGRPLKEGSERIMRGPASVSLGGKPGASFGPSTTLTRESTMATIETDRAGTVQGEVRMLIDGELVEAVFGQALRQREPRDRGGAR